MATRSAAVFSRQLICSVCRPGPSAVRKAFIAHPSRSASDSTKVTSRSSPLSLRDSIATSNAASTSSVSAGDAVAPAEPDVPSRPSMPVIKRGSLASGSIFGDGDDVPKISTEGRAPRRAKTSHTPADGDISATAVKPSLEERDRANVDRGLNPFPHRRARWLRKMVIRSVRRRGRLTTKEKIMQTERESLTRSVWFKTSVKKLVPLARQIAGKRIDDAILQMRFSKKKVAKDVKELLEQAKNEAILGRGMGLGKVQEPSAEPVVVEAQTITLKDGKRKAVTDPTTIYIDQAWANRGPFGIGAKKRAFGRMDKLRHPHTGLSVILKEENTLVREWRDREAKELRRRKTKLWVQLPDRKITAQRQYYSW